MDNKQANSNLGRASRHLAFSLVKQVGDRDWKEVNIDELQKRLYDYGIAIAHSVIRERGKKNG